MSGGANDVINARSSIFYDISGTTDPTVLPVSATKGSTYRWVGQNGGKFYVKQDEGLTTNWTLLTGAASPAVVEAANFAALPPVGVAATLYITTNDNSLYRWTGVDYYKLNQDNSIVNALIFG